MSSPLPAISRCTPSRYSRALTNRFGTATSGHTTMSRPEACNVKLTVGFERRYVLLGPPFLILRDRRLSNGDIQQLAFGLRPAPAIEYPAELPRRRRRRCSPLDRCRDRVSAQRACVTARAGCQRDGIARHRIDTEHRCEGSQARCRSGCSRPTASQTPRTSSFGTSQRRPKRTVIPGQQRPCAPCIGKNRAAMRDCDRRKKAQAPASGRRLPRHRAPPARHRTP